jgi:hypothetical protein
VLSEVGLHIYMNNCIFANERQNLYEY